MTYEDNKIREDDIPPEQQALSEERNM